MRNVASHLAAWLICVAIGLLVGEIAGTVIFYRQQGKLVYLNAHKIGPEARAPQAAPVGQRLHPYLGFGGYYSLNSSTQSSNNLGFAQRTDYAVPFTPKADDLAVFVFGGSVAANIVVPPQGGTSLQQALQRKIQGRNVIVYSMAQGSGKQPQQLIALAMLRAMGQRIDVVVNLDGYNDMAIGYTNRFYTVDPIFPSISILWGIANTLSGEQRSSDFYRTAADILDGKLGMERHAAAANASRLGLTYIYHKASVSFYGRKRAAAEGKYVRSIGNTPEGLERAKRLLGVDLPVDAKADAIESSFDIWLRSDEAMADLSRSAKAGYVHVIQPNQYFTRKKFSPEEAGIALSAPASDTMRIGAERGYALFDQRAETIEKHGIVSGIKMFDDQTEAMYVDNCCHYSKAGENILSDFVADQVVKALSKASRD